MWKVYAIVAVLTGLLLAALLLSLAASGVGDDGVRESAPKVPVPTVAALRATATPDWYDMLSESWTPVPTPDWWDVTPVLPPPPPPPLMPTPVYDGR